MAIEGQCNNFIRSSIFPPKISIFWQKIIQNFTYLLLFMSVYMVLKINALNICWLYYFKWNFSTRQNIMLIGLLKVRCVLFFFQRKSVLICYSIATLFFSFFFVNIFSNAPTSAFSCVVHLVYENVIRCI